MRRLQDDFLVKSLCLYHCGNCGIDSHIGVLYVPKVASVVLTIIDRCRHRQSLHSPMAPYTCIVSEVGAFLFADFNALRASFTLWAFLASTGIGHSMQGPRYDLFIICFAEVGRQLYRLPCNVKGFTILATVALMIIDTTEICNRANFLWLTTHT